MSKNARLRFPGRVGSILLFVLTLTALLFQGNMSPVKAEGSRELVASGGKRALTEWRIDTTAGFIRRTFFRVYANEGEYILMGSSAMGLGLGDIALYQEGQVSSSQISSAALAAITPTLRCSVASGGVLRAATPALTRSMELVGPTTNGGVDGGYIPCVYTVPAGGTGIYWVAMYGPLGPSSATDGDAGTIDAPNITATQQSGVSVWDITVRTGNPSTGVTRPGRVFVDYLAQITGGNGVANRVYSTIYATTTTGYVYQVDLNGLDPYGYILYGNRVGFLDPDGVTPLYHDVVTTNNLLNNPAGGVILPPASARMFFSNPLLSDLPSSILPTPIPPTITNVTYQGSAGGITGYRPIGGDFSFIGNVDGISEIVISLDGVDFQPDNPLNRVIRSQTSVGTNTIHWDGRDNSGSFFPVGNGYKYQLTFHAGEYHFPLLDAENSPNGGPALTLLNPTGGVCPFNSNCHIGFYDDRGYRVSTGATVGTVGVILPGDANSVNPPTVDHADDVNGYDTTTAQRAWGNGTSNGFGNWKGLDLWAYIPVGPESGQINVVDINPSMTVEKSSTTTILSAPGTVNYGYLVTNNGNVTLTGITLSDDNDNEDMSCPDSTLAPTETMTCTATHTFTQAELIANGSPTPGSGTLSNTVTASSNETQDVTDTLNIPIAQVDLALAKRVNNASPKIGDAITFTITLTNQSPSVDATNVVVADVLPAGLTFNSATPSLGSFNSLTGNWTIPTLARNTSVTLLLNVTVTQVGVITNTAEVIACDQPDIDSTPNNQISTEDDQASVTIGSLFDPPSGIKSFTEAGLPVLEFRMVWINSGNTTAIDTQVTDDIPTGTIYLPGSLTCTPRGSSSNASAATALLNTTVTDSFCAYDPINNRVQWQGIIGPDNGRFTEAAAANEVVITFRVTVNDGINQVRNFGVSRTDSDGNDDFTDETVLNVSVVISNQVVWNRRSDSGGGDSDGDDEDKGRTLPRGGGGFLIPVTGFAPGVVTRLDAETRPSYGSTTLALEIPVIKVKSTIVGVELKNANWDVSWLQDQIGWLNGTAYPTWTGNSVLTGHAVNTAGKPSIFSKLRWLNVGEYVYIYSQGYRYTYKVESNKLVQPDDITVLKHEDKAYLTLITCDNYDEKTATYLNRIAVRAVLVDVREEK